MSNVVRGTSLRAGGACVRCRKGKTKCVYENNRAPCKNCAKGMHECYLPSESLAHHHGQSPARVPRPRESLPGERSVSSTHDRPAAPASQVLTSRSVNNASGDKITPELAQECERVVNKTLPACVAFHKPGFIQKLKSGTLDASITNALLTIAARSSPYIIRRYGGQGGAAAAAEHFAAKCISAVMQNLDNPCLGDIQALCLLIIHEWGCRNAIRAYAYLGQAARMAQMYRILAVHQTGSPEPEQFIRDESFRRTLWLIYILDCFLTSSPGRYPALSAHEIKDVALPCPDMSFNFGTPVTVRTLSGIAPAGSADPTPPKSEVGEFGHIVMATQAWRNVIEMLTTVTLETFSEQQCVALENEIEAVRQGLPMHFTDKSGHINLHITMGSGWTYALLHCLLHCATIMVNRRRLLQAVTNEDFNDKAWRATPQHAQIVDRVLTSSHGIISLLLALDNYSDKDSLIIFPLILLFSSFTAGATIAWFSLKGFTPPNVRESSEALVRDAMRFLHEGADAWTLVVPWYRHLTVMAKVLRRGSRKSAAQSQPPAVEPTHQSAKEETASQSDNNPDAMDYERQSSDQPPEPAEDRNGSEPPRRAGFAAINGGSAGASTPATVSPPPAGAQPAPVKTDSPSAPSSAGDVQPAEPAPPGPGGDMTAEELCEAFEHQLLELDDLAAFMGGGV
ncbi:hypothetical protein JX265_011249 [Neoarthrinium moseri]|uniref:Zn(2)-C6 fungal-type domain-containing protein n=1 Tax=Neoarthrinium moseri TaxID=1658444 RepID=A0A9Q0AHT1_9PEZI|nr:uncharacterized protein JN550_010555 [Neoarthrinium moseri]KAI1845856.1 hypothetical protein JX266_007943 [Neoarthrinium moseri]KAI1857514.1 hypothetical protein JX265_011249 [Neoarthrinium moseri]KAI1862090.1 hypothetical protein JN550_010555 [Neoarthrinium moseri]